MTASVRLRDLGLTVGTGNTGPLNAITDVAGVAVGHATIIEGDGPRVVGKGPVRTGVTVILPRQKPMREKPAFAGVSILNGNGDCTGLEWLRESGLLTSPIAITNTHSVGVVRDALVASEPKLAKAHFWSMPVVLETYDGRLNDIDGQHVKAAHVREALGNAKGGPVLEGVVGGGTGMICHEFKGGIGTSSRVLAESEGGWTVGALVQSNYGLRADLRVDGLPVGRLIGYEVVPTPFASSPHEQFPRGGGSIIVILATDAPLLSDQCRRLAGRAAVGLGRAGGGCSDSSGDIFLAFATGNDEIPTENYDEPIPEPFPISSVAHQGLSPLFQAAAEATEEAILNALVSAHTISGCDGITAHALDRGLLVKTVESLRGPSW